MYSMVSLKKIFGNIIIKNLNQNRRIRSLHSTPFQVALLTNHNGEAGDTRIYVSNVVPEWSQGVLYITASKKCLRCMYLIVDHLLTFMKHNWL